MYAFGLAAALLELSLDEVIASVPHDAGAIVVFVLLLGFIYFVWYGSRKSTLDRYAGTSPPGGDIPGEVDGRKADDLR